MHETDPAPGADDAAPEGTLAGWVATTVTVAVVAFLAVEAVARVVAADLPAEQRFYTPFADLKFEHMEALESSPDTVFLGSSMTFHGIRATGLCDGDPGAVYNLALPPGHPTIMQQWLDDLPWSVSPRTRVVWGLSPTDFVGAETEHRARAAYLDSPVGRSGPGAEAEALFDALALVDRRDDLRDPFDALADDLESVTELVEARSELHRCGERVTFRDPVDPEVGTWDFEPDPVSVQVVDEVLSDLSRRGIEVVLLDLPHHPAFVSALRTEDRASYRALLSELAADHGAVVLEPIERYDSPDLFADMVHLGPAGAALLTADVAAQLDGLEYTADPVLPVDADPEPRCPVEPEGSGRVVGSVVGTDGSPVPDLQVRARGDDPDWTEPVLTDVEGGFALDGLAPGCWVLRVDDPTGRTGRTYSGGATDPTAAVELRVEDGATTRHDLVMSDP